MEKSGLDESSRYVISGYAQQRPFASFLPGIAGALGIPMWAFYVNRGQAIAGFGVESKDSPLMEFQPANKAYQLTSSLGFRTFVKLPGGRSYQPFSPWDGAPDAEQRMLIGANDLEIEETCPSLGLKTSVLYFTLPGEPLCGLARRVSFQNLAGEPLAFEFLDGLPALIPYGVNNFLLKELGRTCEAWMEVFNLEERAPFYRVRASIIDQSEVETFQAGHFALAFVEQDGQARLLPALADPAAVFEEDTAFTRARGFERKPLADLLSSRQVTCGRTPCGLFAGQVQLAPGETLAVYSLYGHAGGLEILQRHLPRITHAAYFEDKHHEAQALVDELTAGMDTHTAEPLFDAYCRQNFLDNVLRGGWPALLGNPQSPHVYPIYSRKHGDLERDYNAFFISAEPYSQGEGSYRDVAQNRRDNVLLNPASGDFDIRTFMSLIQIDGYNPRTLKGSSFSLSPERQAELLADLPEPDKLRAILAAPFTPGRLLKQINDHQIPLPAGETPESFLAHAIQESEQRVEAVFFEGYWSDHWEYNLDLIESYLAVFPERQEDLLFGRADLPFFESPVTVQPRAKKYVLVNGIPRQAGSLAEDTEKAALIASRAENPNWMRSAHGQGPVYHATLFAKLFLTALLKFATLDPWGMGIEMEAGRPGWYDALNGLPALFGSGMAESYELLRWLGFLRRAIHDHPGGEARLPVEAADLLNRVERYLELYHQAADAGRDFRYWDSVATAREVYRERTRLGIDGEEKALPLSALDAALAALQPKLQAGIQRALDLNGGLPPTYFAFQVDDFELLAEPGAQGRTAFRAKGFTARALPLFLEGPVKAFKAAPDIEAARELYRRVKESPLFDRKLKMYKVNASLEDQPHDIGRARAFPPGWLENESIWLHMEYKYLLATLKAGLYDEFFEDFRNVLVPFLDPQVYGRSPLENSSFLASSAHPDPSMHGAGFVARLSGSTAEFISMWRILLAGKRPFFAQSGELYLALRPILPGWLFTQEGVVSFRFLGRCTVTYHNPRHLDTFGAGVSSQRTQLFDAQGKQLFSTTGGILSDPHAAWVRDGKAERIEVFY